MQWRLMTLYRETPKKFIFYYYHANELRVTHRSKDSIRTPSHYIQISKEEATTLKNLDAINPELAQEFFKQKVEECTQDS